MASDGEGTGAWWNFCHKRRNNLDDSMTPIVKYLESDILPEDHNESRRIKKQAARYCLYQGKLYRRSFSGPYLRCQSPREATRILEELHDGECGSHSSGRSPVLKARRAEYYCPTMAGDANNQAKKCSQCQRHAPVSNRGYYTNRGACKDDSIGTYLPGRKRWVGSPEPRPAWWKEGSSTTAKLVIPTGHRQKL